MADMTAPDKIWLAIDAMHIGAWTVDEAQRVDGDVAYIRDDIFDAMRAELAEARAAQPKPDMSAMLAEVNHAIRTEAKRRWNASGLHSGEYEDASEVIRMIFENTVFAETVEKLKAGEA